jgi:hypothetical protein
MVDSTAEETKVQMYNDTQRKTKGRLKSRQSLLQVAWPPPYCIYLTGEFRRQDHQLIRDHSLPEDA